MDIKTSFIPNVHERALEHFTPDEFGELQRVVDELLNSTELDPSEEGRIIVNGLSAMSFMAGVTWALQDGEGEAPDEPRLAVVRGSHETTVAPPPRSYGVEDGLVVLRLTPIKAASLLEYLIGGDE